MKCQKPQLEKPAGARGGKAADKVVAQVSKPAVSQGFQPADAANANAPSGCGRAADLEIGDTADWEVCATVSPFAATARRATLSTALQEAGFPLSKGLTDLLNPKQSH